MKNRSQSEGTRGRDHVSIVCIYSYHTTILTANVGTFVAKLYLSVFNIEPAFSSVTERGMNWCFWYASLAPICDRLRSSCWNNKNWNFSIKYTKPDHSSYSKSRMPPSWSRRISIQGTKHIGFMRVAEQVHRRISQRLMIEWYVTFKMTAF